jgi:hypothetical protein
MSPSVKGQHTARRKADVGDRVAAGTGAKHHLGRHVDEPHPAAGIAQNWRQVPGAGEAAAPLCRFIQGIQAGSAGLLTVPGGYAAELAHDVPGRRPR